MKKLLFTLYTLALALATLAQSKSGNVYEFLDLPTSARSVAIGGNHASIGTTEICHIFMNPAQLNDSAAYSVGLNVCPMPQDIVYGSFGVGGKLYDLGIVGLGVQYINYGEFTNYDEYEVEQGKVTARETAIYLMYARKLMPRLTVGAAFKPIISHLAEYRSFGIAMDMGARYIGRSGRFQAAIVARNLGGQITTYDEDGSHEVLPIDLSIGCNYTTEHAPFRLSCTMKDICHWDLSPDRNNRISGGDNLMRHLLLGVEFIPAKGFWFGMGYNHRQRKEARTSSAGGAAGISWGAGICIRNIHVDYGHGRYHLAGSANSISISYDGFTSFLKPRN